MVRNPQSGSGTDSERARELARERGIDVRDTEGPGEAVTIARAAADETDQVVACGGDGTVNEVVRGLDDADALGDVELSVVPTGTGNGFAGNVGVDSVETAFDVLADGPVRSLDLGMADGRPFVESCMGGLVAEASEDTADESKRLFGSLAYILRTLAEAREFDGPATTVTVGRSGDPVWTGEAQMILLGNARRFLAEGRGQADVEDGLLEVVIVEQAPAIDYLADDAMGRLFDRETTHLVEFATQRLAVETAGEAMEFSLDGETVERETLVATAREGALSVRVGDGYDPNPPVWPE